ncbi:MAG: hypothetical protein ABFS38_12965 [Bacteroidota bacterium]
MNRYVTTFLIALLFSVSVYSQDKLVFDDRTGLLTGEVEELVKVKLAENDIEYTTLVDFKVKCEYYFTVLTLVEDDVVVSVMDCDDQLLGYKNLGSQIQTATPEEKSFLLSYNISEIIAAPGKYTDQTETWEESSDTETEAPEDVSFETSDHNTRYFFAPSAYNLKEGELYYNTVYFLLHDIQYGLTDNFSIGMGTSIIGIPIYLTPKISFPVGEKSAFALGDMLIFGTYGTNALGNLLYGSFSTGGIQGNTSIGVGYLATNESDITAKTSSAVFNLSGMARASSHIYLLTENYLFGVNTTQWAHYDRYDAATDTWTYRSEEYIQKLWLWYGVAGIRIINKNKDFVSWQIGITYVINFPGEVPDQYSNWETYSQSGINAYAFPAVSYTRKFGKKY